jgi:hypothetical protein
VRDETNKKKYDNNKKESTHSGIETKTRKESHGDGEGNTFGSKKKKEFFLHFLLLLVNLKLKLEFKDFSLFCALKVI